MQQTLTGNGNSNEFVVNIPERRLVSAHGTFGGSTTKLQCFVGTDGAGTPADVWRDVAGASFTSDGHAFLDLAAGRYRWNNAGGSSISVVVYNSN